MKAVAWHGKRDVRVDTVPDPAIEEPTDAIVRITSSGICGSDLHLYEVLGMFMTEGDILGHEPMGIVEEVGSAVSHIAKGDRVVVPFNISCGHCWMCDRQLFSQCETTQVHEHEKPRAAVISHCGEPPQAPVGRPAEGERQRREMGEGDRQVGVGVVDRGVDRIQRGLEREQRRDDLDDVVERR